MRVDFNIFNLLWLAVSLISVLTTQMSAFLDSVLVIEVVYCVYTYKLSKRTSNCLTMILHMHVWTTANIWSDRSTSYTALWRYQCRQINAIQS
jgi:hypothetical protein